MAKRKFTTEILELIEQCAADAYTPDEIRKKADISKQLMSSPEVLEAIEKGRTKWFIEAEANGESLDIFSELLEKTPEEVNSIREECQKEITSRKEEIKKEHDEAQKKKEELARNLLDPLIVGSANAHFQLHEELKDKIDTCAFRDAHKEASRRIKDGDNSLLIDVLVSNINQLHYFNGYISMLISGKLGEALRNFDKLTSMQLKVMQETRKSIMAINEITNPKRTTFVKKAEQHNHIHQNSEKKEQLSNELENESKLIEYEKDAIGDSEIIAKQEVNGEIP